MLASGEELDLVYSGELAGLFRLGAQGRIPRDNDVIATYSIIIDLGMMDAEQAVDEFNDKLERAGEDVLQAEFERQFADFISDD